MFKSLDTLLARLDFIKSEKDFNKKRLSKSMKKFMPHMNTNIYTDAHELDDKWPIGTLTYEIDRSYRAHDNETEIMHTEMYEYANIYYYPSSGVFSIDTGITFIYRGHYENWYDEIPDTRKIEELFRRKIQAQLDDLTSRNKFAKTAFAIMDKIKI